MCRAAHRLLCLSLQQRLQVIGSSNKQLMLATNNPCAPPAQLKFSAYAVKPSCISRLLQVAFRQIHGTSLVQVAAVTSKRAATVAHP